VGVISDLRAVAIAVAVVLGAWWSAPFPVVVAAGAVVGALLVGRILPLLLALVCLAAGLGHAATVGLEPPPARPFEGEVLLVGDPEEATGAVRVEVKAGDHRLDGWARGAAGSALRGRQAGQRAIVEGHIEPTDDQWLAQQHIVGRLVIDDVAGWSEGNAFARAANSFRDVLVRGAEDLPTTTRSLFTGFVFGDDREQTAEVADDFRGSGLTHLLAVSGQNVAFVLAVAAPLLGRLPLRSRWVATLAVLLFFAALTRFEPSVLRATAMAALATTALTTGRPASSLRLLSLAVAGLVLVDPFLIRSVGFGLSVAASAGIIVLSGPLSRSLPGPGFVIRPLAVTLAAQAGVAPLLVPIFGGLPVASIAANVLAEPVAGVVMVWGLTGGVAAGLLGGPWAAVAHLPTRAGVGWIETVARHAADAPLGELKTIHVVAIGLLIGAMAVARRRDRTRTAAVCAALAVAVTCLPAAQLVGDARGVTPLDGLGQMWVGHDPSGGVVRVVVLDGSPRDEALLRALRRRGVRAIDLVVSRSGSSRDGLALAVLRRRVEIRSVWAPSGHEIAYADSPVPGVYELGGLRLAVSASSPGLEVHVEHRRPP
jgi:competence protein ComEC